MEQSLLIKLVQPRKVDYPERWTRFSKLSRLERANPLSFRLKFPYILAEWIMPLVSGNPKYQTGLLAL